jgi:TRAP-type C4-dicarboxylate transport system permease small subunit
MGNHLRRLNERLVRGLEWVVIVLMGGLVLDVLWQVASRYVLRSPSSWTDELATLLIIWVALLGASVAFIRQGHLGVDYFVGKLPQRPRLLIEVCVYLLVAFFALAVLLIGGLKLVGLTLLTGQVSPALGVKMGHVYLALPVSGFFILVFALTTAAQRVAALRGSGREGRR